ncbi:dihydrofolate reductase [Paenibacillus aceti]|uniref:Dihydrofolate reductase n=1 Tax=Paenibacillus aceti TaxID=1820010 RepID=A0ABQ1VU82_9BACL|nr:dihydrofolate reductase [Paenibacillus aceti]GGF94564.1 dihydrofolate reductase [Paenibacillus aceti]
MGMTFIWAMARNGVIGRNNDLPWRLPADMAFFKAQTTGKTVLMGRKTWESMRSRPLPNRRNIVMTNDRGYHAEGAEVVHSEEQVLALAAGEELMVIGGAGIYKLLIPYADRLHVTKIDEEIEGDTYFPEIDWSQFRLEQETEGIRDEKNPYHYRFMTYVRQHPSAE